MALLAANNLMLANQREFRAVMIKGNSFQINFPAIGFMAIVAVGFEAIPMRRFLGNQACCKR
jgi:hypothetical protein